MSSTPPRVSTEEVRRIADLANLAFPDHEIESFREQFQRILEFFHLLAEVDTTDVPPTDHVLDRSAPLRPDEPKPGLDQDGVSRNAPEWEDGRFVTPPAVEPGS